jgi:hypothetical protein
MFPLFSRKATHQKLAKKHLNIFPLFSQKNEWRKFRAPKGVGTPKGRRSHTATVFQVQCDQIGQMF